MAVAKQFDIKILVFSLVVFLSCTGVSGHPHDQRAQQAPQKIPAPAPKPADDPPKTVKDNFPMNKQVIPIPQNDSKKPVMYKNLVSKLLGEDSACESVTYKVNPGTLRNENAKQGNEDDDDDDDGGEYEGAADYASCKKKDQEEPQEQKSVPLIIMRGFDVIGMGLPVPTAKDCKKPKEEKTVTCDRPTEPHDCFVDTTTEAKAGGCGAGDEGDVRKNQNVFHNYNNRNAQSGVPKGGPLSLPKEAPKLKDWGEWSPCSKTCGVGVQSRSRLYPSGTPEHDTQFKPCRLADCPGSGPRFASDVQPYEYRDLVRN